MAFKNFCFFSRLLRVLLFSFCLCIFISVFQSAFASETVFSPTNFNIEIKVANESLSERNRAFIDGLKGVLLNNAGVDEQTISSSAFLKTKLKNPDSLVKSYSYVTQRNLLGYEVKYLEIQFDQGEVSEIVSKFGKKIAVNNVAQTPLAQQIKSDKRPAEDLFSQPSSFSSDIIKHEHAEAEKTINYNDGVANKIIKNSAFPIVSQVKKSPQNRVLAWLVTLENGAKKSYIIDDSNFSDVSLSFQKYAQSFNMNLLYPVMDLEDMLKITADDVCSLNADIIREASEKYSSRFIIVGCIVKTPEGMRSQWLLFDDRKQYRWDLSGGNYELILQQSAANMAKIITPKLVSVVDKNIEEHSSDISSLANASKIIILEIEGVKDLERYAEVVNYLKTIKQISDVELVALNAFKVKLKVTCQGGKDFLVSQINMPNLHKLQSVSDVSHSVTGSAIDAADEEKALGDENSLMYVYR